MYLLDQVRDAVSAVMAGEQPREQVYFYGNGYRGGFRRVRWLRLGTDSAVFHVKSRQTGVVPSTNLS